MTDKSFAEGYCKTIAAVVVTFNRKELLRECLEALKAQTRSPDEIIVIDNASTDSTNNMMLVDFPNITYIQLTENIGGAGGYHEGMKFAYKKGYDWIWVMDDDSIPSLNSLEQLVASKPYQELNPSIITGSVYFQDGSICKEHRRFFNPHKVVEYPVNIEYYKKDYFELDTASFIGMLVNRETLNEIGLPIRDFFIDYDDIEFCLRVKYAKGKIFTVPSSKIIHKIKIDNIKIPMNYCHWRKYYWHRNRLWTYLRYQKTGVRFYMNQLIEILKTQAWILLRTRQKKLASTYILWLATHDALRGRLGKIVNPDDSRFFS